MANNFGVKKNGSTRNYIGGELIYFNSRQVKQIYVKKNNAQKMVWQYDITAPSIVITSSTAVRNSPYYTLTGYASDSESGVASVSINGVSVGASFSIGYTLGEGVTNFTISATDKAGNSSSTSFSIIYVNTGADAPVSYSQARHGYEGNWNNISIGSDGWWSQTYSDSSGPYSYGATARTWAQMQVCFRKKAGVKYMYSGISTGTRSNCYHTWRLVTDSGTIVTSGDVNGEFTCTVPDAYVSRSDLYLYVFGQSFDEGSAGSGYVAHSSATVKIKKCTYGI